MTENILSELGLKTMGEVRRQGDIILVACSPKQGRFLIRTSLGIDCQEGVQEQQMRQQGPRGEVADGSRDAADDEGGEDYHELQKSIGTKVILWV